MVAIRTMYLLNYYDWFNALCALNECFIHFLMLNTLLLESYFIYIVGTAIDNLYIKVKEN